MAKSKSGIVLNEGEELIMELEAELWATSSNIIARIIGAIFKIIALIFGIRKKGYLVITNKRVVEVSCDKFCWVFDQAKNVKYVLPNSVKEVGYTKGATFFCCCPAYNLYYESWTQKTSIMLKGANEAKAQEIVDTFYNVISTPENA